MVLAVSGVTGGVCRCCVRLRSAGVGAGSETARVFSRFGLHEVGRWGAARRRRVCVQSRARGRAIALDCLWIEGACSRSIGRQRANFELSRQARLGRMCCELRVSLRVQRGVARSVYCGVLRQEVLYSILICRVRYLVCEELQHPHDF